MNTNRPPRKPTTNATAAITTWTTPITSRAERLGEDARYGAERSSMDVREFAIAQLSSARMAAVIKVRAAAP
ncbi:hypothetical protein GCM10022251_78340 [Phytohabitans flavus]|uniref:Uncharacterized protein n=1 Tax=Phytohabitans flavus TaxID=1076124 RepID=A0A6F8XYG9_9ACTN|nr:hypothetical protein Pflav_051810 [Phytohabitans flavus]